MQNAQLLSYLIFLKLEKLNKYNKMYAHYFAILSQFILIEISICDSIYLFLLFSFFFF